MAVLVTAIQVFDFAQPRTPPLPQPKSAVADFGHFVEWPNPRCSEVRLGRGRGWGSGHATPRCAAARPPTPTLPHKGGVRAALAQLILAPMGTRPAMNPERRSPAKSLDFSHSSQQQPLHPALDPLAIEEGEHRRLERILISG